MSEPSTAERKRIRRRFQFRLRTLMIGVTVVALVTAVISRLPMPNEITLKQLQSVKEGMTEDQVRDLLGRPDAIRPNVSGGVDWQYGILWPDVIESKDRRVVSAIRF